MGSCHDDLIQAGMMAVMRIAKSREEVAGLSASYIRKVAYSAIVDEIRRVRSRSEIPLDTVSGGPHEMHTDQPDPHRLLAAREIAAAIRRCLARLIEPRRLAVTLHLLGYAKPQIADRLGWNQKRARNLVFRGLENLRACLRESEEVTL